MKIDKIEEKEKKFITLVKRRDEIRDLIYAIPWVKLKEPIQDGWIASITLIDEAVRRKDGNRMLEAIKLCSNPHKIHKGAGQLVSQIRKSDNFNKVRHLFLQRTWDGHIVYQGPSLKSLSKKEFNNLTELQQKWFDEAITEEVSRWGGQKLTSVKYVCNIPIHYLSIKVSKHMLTQVKNISPALEKEKSFVDYKLEEYDRTRSYNDGHWNSSISSPNVRRRHWTDAINHFKNGDLEDPKDYTKLKKRVKK